MWRKAKKERSLRAKLLRRTGLTLVVLLLLEGVLRLVGFGGHAPVLREVASQDGVTYVSVDQTGIARFFDVGPGGSIRHGLLTMPKTPNTVRIFALGASAIYGYPQERHLSAMAFLEAMLGDVWPDRNVEIINLGATGVASFPVMCIADEALKYDPDLLIVWTGNNEFYGTYGVASSNGVHNSTSLMRLKYATASVAIVDAVTQSIVRLRGDGVKRTLMDQMVGVASIGPDDPIRDLAARNLENHLSHIVEQCVARGVPVILCTLPANERDMSPIGVITALPLSDDKQSIFDADLARAQRLIVEDPEAALDALRAAHDLYDQHALVEYLMGRCLSDLGNHEEAAKAYRRARDLDPMPWRAPSKSGDAVRHAATKGAVLCDLEAVFRRASPGGTTGWELLDDQVHPNIPGQLLVARSILDSMGQFTGRIRVDPADVAALPSNETYFDRLEVNPYDGYVALELLVKLFKSRLFKGTSEAALERTRRKQEQFNAQMSQWQREVVRRWVAGSDDGPRIPVTAAVAEAAQARGDYEEASRLFMIAQRTVGETQPLYMQYGFRALFCRAQVDPRPDPQLMARARHMSVVGERLLIVSQKSAAAISANLGMIYKYIGSDDKAIEYLEPIVSRLKEPGDFLIINALVEALVQTGQIQRARDILQTEFPNPQLRARCQRLLARLEQG